MEECIAQFLKEPSINLLGALLGFCVTQQQKESATKIANCLFQFVGLMPTSDYYVSCPYKHQPDGMTWEPQMKTVTDPSRQSGFRFYCRGERFRPHPITKLDPQLNTIFAKKKLSSFEILKLLVFFFDELPVTKAEIICRVQHNTAVNWYKTFREVMYLAAWHDFRPLGGRRFVLELDETMTYHSKYNQGRILATQRNEFWTFGGVCRITGKVFAIIVNKRDRQTLFPIMRINSSKN